MVERLNVSEFNDKPKSAFENVTSLAPVELINFLKLAEREGAYKRLSEKRKQTLQMRFVEGLSMPQIAKRLEISKQAVSQTLKLTPGSLYKQMLHDSMMHRTNNVSFTEILATYSGYTIYLNKIKKSRE